MIYKYTKLLTAVVISLMFLGQLSLGVKAIETGVHAYVLFSSVGVRVPAERGSVPDRGALSAGGYRPVHAEPAVLGVLHTCGVEL